LCGKIFLFDEKIEDNNGLFSRFLKKKREILTTNACRGGFAKGSNTLTNGL
jgi:hypothetical protein